MNKKFYQTSKETGEKEEISKDRAIFILECSYKNINQIIKDLENGLKLQTMFSIISFE